MRRCAIYTRKSSAEGLQQEFNSLHAQREACEAYVLSQRSEGWTASPAGYDDGGWSGGTLERPALNRLMADVDAGEVDIVVCYKIDRLSRSLRDFLNLVSAFERRGVTFVAVTQSFNTTTSMGRLTLNVLLSFAQFEREITSDRLKDKFAASRARGLYLGGRRPYGFDVRNGHLSIREDEAKIVRLMFRRYPMVNSLNALAEELRRRGLVNAQGARITWHWVRSRLMCPLYIGKLHYKKQIIPGVHPAIVSLAVWERVQKHLRLNKLKCLAKLNKHPPGMLRGLLYSPSGFAMGHHHTNSRHDKTRYRYYVTKRPFVRGEIPAERFRAQELEAAVLAVVETVTSVVDFEQPADRYGRLRGAAPDESDRAGLVRRLVERVDIGTKDMAVTFHNGGVSRAPLAGRIRDTVPVGRPPTRHGRRRDR